MSERKLAHLQKLKDDYAKAAQKVEAEEGMRLRKYREKIIADGCFHPETTSSVNSDDDGYGKWCKVKVTKCRLCGKVLDVDYNYKE